MIGDLQTFLALAMELGLAPRLKAMILEVEQAIADYPPNADGRYRHRLEDQLERLRHPDLRLVAALIRGLCEDDPTRRQRIASVMARLAPRHAYLRDLLPEA